MFPWSVTATADMPSSRDALAELRQAIGAVEEGVLAVEVEVNEVAGHVRFYADVAAIVFESSAHQ